LDLSPKSKAHIKGLLHVLWDYAMWRADVPTQRNPMELVTIRGVSKRTRISRCLTVEEFHKFSKHLSQPFYTIALICVSFGLRISECLALKWSDVDWLNGKLSVQRGIVRQRVGDVKTIYSQRKMSIDAGMLEVLSIWRRTSQFEGDADWIFASPAKLGRQPWCYDQVARYFSRAAEKAAIGTLGTHAMRHTYRSWLDAVGTPIAVQQKLMRHADIRTTMNIYGDVVTDEMAQAHRRVVDLALNHTN
jgi:integrase